MCRRICSVGERAELSVVNASREKHMRRARWRALQLTEVEEVLLMSPPGQKYAFLLFPQL